MEAGVDVADRQRPQPRGGELERERNAVEPRAQLGDRRRVGVRHGEIGLLQARALDEQLHGFRAQQRCRACLAVGNAQRQHRIGLLAADMQRLAARREDADAGD